MMGSIFNRGILAATFCVLALTQTANAQLAPTRAQKAELTRLQRQDVNDDRTVAGMAYQAEKKAGSDCPFADKSSRTEVPQSDIPTDSKTANSSDVRGNSHVQ